MPALWRPLSPHGLARLSGLPGRGGLSMPPRGVRVTTDRHLAWRPCLKCGKRLFTSRARRLCKTCHVTVDATGRYIAGFAATGWSPLPRVEYEP